MHKIIIGSPESELNHEILLKREIFSPSNEILNKPNTFSLDEDEESNRNYYDNLDSKEDKQLQTKRSMKPPKSNQYHCSIIVSPPFQSAKSFDPQISQKQEGLDEHWQKSGFRIITLVARFIYQLKTNSEKLKIKLMNYRIFNIIHDLSGDFKQFKQQQSYISTQFLKTIHIQKSTMSKYSKIIKNKILNRVQVIQPESTFKIIWDIIVVFVIVINIFYIPMSLSFEISKDNAISSMFFETIPSYIFILEILLNFNTAYYLNGIIHSKRTQIFWYYLKGNFFWDLLIAIPFILVQFSIPYIQFVLLLRVTRVRSMVQNVEDLLNAKDSIQAILDLAKLVYFIVFVTHMCACGWHLLGQIEIEIYNDNNSWLQYYDCYGKPWTDRYIMSLYWSVITTLTVGYGDVVPQTTLERFFVIFVAMVICGVFGYTISTIGEILKNLEEKEQYFKQQMKGVNQYIKDKNLNFQLSLKVRKYFEYQIQIQLKQNQLDEEIMRGLNDQLKQEVLVDIYKKLLKKSTLITQNFNEKIIDNLCQKVKQVNYAPGDDVISVNCQGDRLIFIVDGQINCFSKGIDWSQDNSHNNNGRFFSLFQSGQVIGEQEFIMHSQFKHQYKAQTFVQVAILERSEFIEILKQQNDQYIKFNEQREKLIYQSKYRRICDVCKWTHHYLDCPFVFYQPHRWKIIKAAKSSVPNKRNDRYTRTTQRDLQVRLNKDFIQESGVDFMASNQFLQENEINQEYLSKFGLKFESVNQDSQNKRQSTERLLTSRGSIDKSILSKRQSMFLQPLKASVKQTVTKLRSICQVDEESKAFSSSGTISHGIVKEESLIIRSPTKESFQEIEQRQQPLKNFNESLDIDIAQEYSNYYPSFNLVNVIEELNRNKNTHGGSYNRSQLQERLKNLKLKSSKYQSNRDIRSLARMTSSDRNITMRIEQ